MHKIILHNLGPIDHCEIDLNELTVLTGPQSNGKSTVAKAVYFFRTIKDDIVDLMLRSTSDELEIIWRKRLTKKLKDKFMQLFGSTYGMSNQMEAMYYYDYKTYIKVFLKPNYKSGGPNYVNIEYSRNLADYLNDLDAHIFTDITVDQMKRYKDQLADLFCDRYETIFIPAGRNIITLLTSQLNYIFASMNESQKRGIDYCTQGYIQLVLRLKPLFGYGIEGLLSDKVNLTQEKFNLALAKKMKNLITKILKGRYQYENGEEKLYIGKGQDKSYVKINFASSGQQETVWITNILFYCILENRPVFLIVEEPESHLYPDAQKLITELLSMFMHNGNSLMITTHSPYVLGTMNNLIYADVLRGRGIEEVVSVVDVDTIMDMRKVSAYHVQGGTLCNAVDDDMRLIKSELIDGASVDITNDCDALYELSIEEEDLDGDCG